MWRNQYVLLIVRYHQHDTVGPNATHGGSVAREHVLQARAYDISDISRLHFITTCVQQVGMTKCEREIWRYQSLHILCLHFVEYIALTLSDCLSVLALSAVALAISSALSLSAGLSALGSLRWLSALWRWLLAQRCLSAPGYQRLALCACSQRCGAGSSLGAFSRRWAISAWLSAPALSAVAL